MDVQKFIETVRAMRQAQNDYFGKGRKFNDLVKSKDLEKKVDQALADGILIHVAGTVEETDGPLGEGQQTEFIEGDLNETEDQ
jgi:hypothetical protein